MSEDTRTAAEREEAMKAMRRPIEPIKLFDDFFYVGSRGVGIYVLKTSEGLVLFDASDNINAYDEFIVPGMKKLGLEGEKILVCMLTHAHFDHYLGAEQIRRKAGCEIGLSKEDIGYLSWSYDNVGPGKEEFIPHCTMILEDGKDYVYGDHTVRVIHLPGHTPGCLGFAMDVHEGEEKHRVAIMGGYGIFGPGNYPDKPYPYTKAWAVNQALQFAESCIKFWDHVKETGCDVYLNPHPHLCDLIVNAEKQKERKEGEPNAFVIGTEGVRTWIVERYNACIESAARFSGMFD